ncbi:MAG: OmpH family outer membrane protein [Thiohalocapsa sp.]
MSDYRRAPLLFGAMLLSCLLSMQSTAAEITIAVIDPNRIVEESPQYEEARGMLSSEVKERESELLDQQEDLDRLNQKLEQGGALMSEEEMTRLQNDIRARKRRLRYAKAELQEDFALRQTELRTKLVKQVEEVVQQIAKEKGIDVILSEGLVYFSQRVDISSEVVERLKQEFEGR